MVHRLVLAVTEDREVDPGEVGTGSGAPDDVGHLEDPLVGQQGPAVAHPHDPGEAPDPGGGEVLGLYPDQRGGVEDEPGAHPAADRRLHGEHAMADDPEQQGLVVIPRRRALDAERDMAGLLARQPGRVPAGDLEGDLGSGVAGSDHEDASLLELGRVVVAGRMELEPDRVGLQVVGHQQRYERSRTRPMGSSPQAVSPCSMANSAAAARVETPILA